MELNFQTINSFVWNYWLSYPMFCNMRPKLSILIFTNSCSRGFHHEESKAKAIVWGYYLYESKYGICLGGHQWFCFWEILGKFGKFGFLKCKFEGKCSNFWKTHQTFRNHKIEKKLKINSWLDMTLWDCGINDFANISPLKGLTFYIHTHTHTHTHTYIYISAGHIIPIYWTMKMRFFKITFSHQKSWMIGRSLRKTIISSPRKKIKKIPDSLIGMKIKIRSGMCPAIDVRSQVSRWCVRSWDLHGARSRRSRHSQRYVRPLKPRRWRSQAIPSYRTQRRTSRALPSIDAEHATSGNHRLQTSLSSEGKNTQTHYCSQRIFFYNKRIASVRIW